MRLRDSIQAVQVLDNHGQVRSCVVPHDWFGGMAPTAVIWDIRKLDNGSLWLGILEDDLAGLVADTVGQIATGFGTVSEKRVALLRLLCTPEEWAVAETLQRVVEVASNHQRLSASL